MKLYRKHLSNNFFLVTKKTEHHSTGVITRVAESKALLTK